MVIRLAISHSSGKKTTFTTEALVTTVGSNPFCEALIEDPSVAARQCTLTRHLDGRVFLEARAPGLRMDGNSVPEGQAVLLHQGSKLSFGASEAVVEFEAVSRKGSSTYVIQLSVGEFGGMPWTEHHVFSEPSRVREVLEAFSSAPLERRQHAFWSDATLGVWVVQLGHVIEFVNLSEYFSTTINEQPLTLPEVRASESIDADELLEEGVELPLRLDWPRLETRLPKLMEPLLQSTETLRFVGPVEDEWLACTKGAPYGSSPSDDDEVAKEGAVRGAMKRAFDRLRR